MATHDIFMPALSSTMTEGKIVEWLKKPGDKVGRGESVLVVESDKADMDVESFNEGYLAAVLMPAGSTAPVGDTIGLIVESEDEIEAVQSKASPSSQELATPEKSNTNSISTPKPSVKTSSNPVQTSEPIKDSIVSPLKAPQIVNTGRIVASPKAKKLASQKGVDLATVRGTGPHGRIQAEDVSLAVGQPVSVPWVAESSGPAAQFNPIKVESKNPSANSQATKSLEGSSFGAPGETVAFNTLQQAVNRSMEASLEVPCFRVGYSLVTEKLDAFYKEVKPNGVTMTALLAKAVGVTLARHPQVNSCYTTEGIVYPPQVNVAIAVAMEDGGLITPVLKDADKSDLFELSRTWADLVKRSRAKQLQPDEYSTGTFTLSNLGMFGVDRFDAILPPSTGAILAVAASKLAPLANKDGSIAVKRQMQVNLTADHRVIYGADGAAFLRDLADLIENRPESLASLVK